MPRFAQGLEPVVLISPDLRPSVMGVARALQSRGLLRVFVTGLSLSRHATKWLHRAGGRGLLRAFRSRTVPDWLQVPTQHLGRHEMPLQLASRLGLPERVRHALWIRSEPAFDVHVAHLWAGRAPCLYGMENASVETFEAQRRLGGLNVLWQVIAHRAVLSQLEREELATLGSGPRDAYQEAKDRSQDWIDARKDRQVAASDLILCNSEFVRESFLQAGVAAERLTVAPTACPKPTIQAPHPRVEAPRIVLYAAQLSLRKGIGHLLQAWRTLGPRTDAELWIAGSCRVPDRVLSDLPPGVRLLGALPRAEVEKLMLRASLFVLPTLAEGRSHAVLEALSAGLPVITTRESGCSDLVIDGETGFLVPARDPSALAAMLVHCLGHTEQLSQMGGRCLERARDWDERAFERIHGRAIEELLSRRGIFPGNRA